MIFCLRSVCLAAGLSFYLSDILLIFWTTFVLITKLESWTNICTASPWTYRAAGQPKNLLPLPCKECSKSFSESGSLKTHLTLIQEKSHLLVKNVPNNFLRRSHSPVPCSLFHKRKSFVSFKDSKNSNIMYVLIVDSWGHHWPRS